MDNAEAYIVLVVQCHGFCFVLYFSVYEKHCTIHFIPSVEHFLLVNSRFVGLEPMGVLSFTVLLHMYVLRCEKWYMPGGSGKSGVLWSTGQD